MVCYIEVLGVLGCLNKSTSSLSESLLDVRSPTERRLECVLVNWAPGQQFSPFPIFSFSASLGPPGVPHRNRCLHCARNTSLYLLQRLCHTFSNVSYSYSTKHAEMRTSVSYPLYPITSSPEICLFCMSPTYVLISDTTADMLAMTFERRQVGSPNQYSVVSCVSPKCQQLMDQYC